MVSDFFFLLRDDEKAVWNNMKKLKSNFNDILDVYDLICCNAKLK